MIDENQYLQWLQNPSVGRVVLVEAFYQGGVEYFSSSAFVSVIAGNTDPTVYDELLTGSVETFSSIDQPVTVGSIELINDGSLDDWLSRPWIGHPLRVYLGDKAWSRNDFRLVIDGINNGISQPDIATVSFSLYERMQRLEKQLQENNLPSGEAAPICLGEVFNCGPVLRDSVTLKYQVNDGPIESLIVRDNGINITANCAIELSQGMFLLGAASVGKITCDVVEAHKTLDQIAEFIAQRYGESVDYTNFAAFNNSAILGYYAPSAVNGSRVLKDLAESLGVFPRFSLAGKLQLIRFDLQGESVLTIDDNDISESGLHLKRVEQPATAINLEYRRNWTPQQESSQAGAVTTENRDLYSREYSKVEISTDLLGYPHAEPRNVKTYIARESDAQLECNRRSLLRLVPRQVWGFSGFLSASLVSVGDQMTVFYDGFGFKTGRVATVLSVRLDVLFDEVEIEIFL
jgi:hypothetical protein